LVSYRAYREDAVSSIAVSIALNVLMEPVLSDD